MFENIIQMTDSYKVGHAPQYQPGTERISSYLEARSGAEYTDMVFFGLQYFLKRYLMGGLSDGVVVTLPRILQAERFFQAHFGTDAVFNKKGWMHIAEQHGGRLPVEIRAVPEGTVVPKSNVMMTIENTDPNCYWLTNYLETLLVQTWYPSTTATISREMKKIIRAALVRSGTDTLDNLQFRLHDFGYRGVSSPESAALGGAGHLLNFKGTDTLAACELAMEYYNSDMPGYSIPAAEHSTITSWGEGGEERAYANMLKQFPTGLVAVVSDSWDIRKAVSEVWGNRLKDQILAREGVLVIRPDSGDPCKILPDVLALAGDRFGYRTNEKGYKVLCDKVRFIQGDGIKRTTLGDILNAVMNAGWSADNLTFGSGGGLLQDCNRDTQNVAMKCSETVVNGVAHDVYKRPATDPGKGSKRGRLMLVRRNGTLETVREGEAPAGDNVLVPVFRNGQLIVDQNFEDIRKRAALV